MSPTCTGSRVSACLYPLFSDVWLFPPQHIYHQEAKAYIAHLAKNTEFSLQGTTLADQLASETVVKDSDGSHWIALYQRCVHLECTVPFRDDCVSFKCPCHGSHYNVTGEFLDGPAPRSLDRFAISFNGEDVVVNIRGLQGRRSGSNWHQLRLGGIASAVRQRVPASLRPVE